MAVFLVTLLMLTFCAFADPAQPISFESAWNGSNSTEFSVFISKYSTLGTEEGKTGFVPRSICNQTIELAHSFKHASRSSSAALQTVISSQADGKQYDCPVTGTVSIINLLNDKKRSIHPFQANFSSNSPNSGVINLLPRNVLLDEKKGWYIKRFDILELSINIEY